MKPIYKRVIYIVVFFTMYFSLSYGGMYLERYLETKYITGIFYELYALISSILLGMLFAYILINFIKTKANIKAYLISASIFLAIAFLPFINILQYNIANQFNTLLGAFSIVILVTGICTHKKLS